MPQIWREESRASEEEEGVGEVVEASAAPKIMDGVARLEKNIPQETGAGLTQGAPHGSPKNSQVLRHSSSLHCSSSLLAGQDTIPAVDVLSTSLVLNLVPPPQGLSHSLHSLHSPTSHPA